MADDRGAKVTQSDPGGGKDAAGPYLLVACLVVGLQAVALFAFAVLELLSAKADRLGLAISTGVFFIAIGAGLAVCAIALRRRASWARGPIVLAQLITLGLAWNFRTLSPPIAAIVLLVVALIALVALLAPATTEALTTDDRRGD
ncbi:hypothetical protein [Solicola gregarius]|uniref:Integral membrane protein n=1 Tax=Solicola gregarius TaxID=2908642 RepID=A0AA46TIU7_9ACTN|nr:hypothetical protein [Solicola gregarius]UYM06021.1 hypothetical protein L0C25_02820 [Solicola gregarius]